MTILLGGKVIDSCDEYINLEWWMKVGDLRREDPVLHTVTGNGTTLQGQEKADEWARRIAKRGMV